MVLQSFLSVLAQSTQSNRKWLLSKPHPIWVEVSNFSARIKGFVRSRLLWSQRIRSLINSKNLKDLRRFSCLLEHRCCLISLKISSISKKQKSYISPRTKCASWLNCSTKAKFLKSTTLNWLSAFKSTQNFSSQAKPPTVLSYLQSFWPRVEMKTWRTLWSTATLNLLFKLFTKTLAVRRKMQTKNSRSIFRKWKNGSKSAIRLSLKTWTISSSTTQTSSGSVLVKRSLNQVLASLILF